MFGAGSQGVNVLGIGKFNPAGYLIDPTGPLSARIVAASSASESLLTLLVIKQADF